MSLLETWPFPPQVMCAKVCRCELQIIFALSLPTVKVLISLPMKGSFVDDGVLRVHTPLSTSGQPSPTQVLLPVLRMGVESGVGLAMRDRFFSKPGFR